MSKKSKQKKQKSHKGNRSNRGPRPSAIAMPQRKVVPIDVMLDRIYTKEDLSTTCLRQCTCCRVACPQMKFCEATSIIDHIWATWSKEDKRALLVNAVKYFFSDSLVKPCLMLNGNACKVYARRPLNCRLYGLWPQDSWDNRVAMFSKSTGLPKEKLPLNTQCQNVKRKVQPCKECNGTGKLFDLSQKEGPPVSNCNCCGGSGKLQPPPFTKDQISAMFENLDKADSLLGVSDLKISTSWNYRTFHDWILLKFWGEHVLSQWTHILLTTETPEQRQALMEVFEKMAHNLVV